MLIYSFGSKKRFLHLNAAALCSKKILNTQNENNGDGKKCQTPLFSVFWLFVGSVAAHKCSQFSDALYRERRGAQRFHRYAHQLHRVIVRGDAV